VPFPAGAGINRTLPLLQWRRRSVPRRRGDQPIRRSARARNRNRSPQARGSTAPAGAGRTTRRPFPAGAGINRPRGQPGSCPRPVPRRRGDQPCFAGVGYVACIRSPQARGSTASIGQKPQSQHPFPAGAGINRILTRRASPGLSVPRRRGDQPHLGELAYENKSRSPQARGSTGTRAIDECINDPFPAGAGINRKINPPRICRQAVPRRRGDQPEHFLSRPGTTNRSPQARGSTGARAQR